MRSLILVCALAMCAVGGIASALSHVFDGARAIFARFVDVRPLVELFISPQLAIAGPSDTPVAPTLSQRNRHEAGLARLGAVRHR